MSFKKHLTAACNMANRVMQLLALIMPNDLGPTCENKKQEKWDRTTEKVELTKKLIPNIGEWINCIHGNIHFYLTQVLRWYGYFRVNLKKFHLAENDKCSDCGEI